jgi:hypothetical protein
LFWSRRRHPPRQPEPFPHPRSPVGHTSRRRS